MGHFLAPPGILDHLLKRKLKVLSVLGTANSGKGLTRTGIRGLTYSKKEVTGQRRFLFSQKQIPWLHIQMAISKEKEGLRERVIAHWVTSELPLLSVSPLAVISKWSGQVQMTDTSGISQTSHTFPGQGGATNLTSRMGDHL